MRGQILYSEPCTRPFQRNLGFVIQNRGPKVLPFQQHYSNFRLKLGCRDPDPEMIFIRYYAIYLAPSRRNSLSKGDCSLR